MKETNEDIKPNTLQEMHEEVSLNPLKGVRENTWVSGDRRSWMCFNVGLHVSSLSPLLPAFVSDLFVICIIHIVICITW